MFETGSSIPVVSSWMKFDEYDKIYWINLNLDGIK